MAIVTNLSNMHHHQSRASSTGKGGFSLIEISIVLAVLSVVLAGLLPFILESQRSDDVDTTMERMKAIEEALVVYKMRNNALPCPANNTLSIRSSDFGVEADKSGNDCMAGALDPNRQGAAVVWGGVPTKALRLPDDYAFDGWGRRFSYKVAREALEEIHNFDLGTDHVVMQDLFGNQITNTAAYALISHGPNGHGGYTADGQQYGSGSENLSEHRNCECDETLAAAFTGNNIRIGVASGNGAEAYDDIVRYKTPDQLNFGRDIEPLTSDITVTVHQSDASADFTTVNAAIESLKSQYVPGGGVATINLLSGFEMREQVILRAGQDLGWMMLMSEDATVPIIRSELNTGIGGRYPAFGADHGSTLPLFNTKFVMDTSAPPASPDPDVTKRDGVALFNNSRVLMWAGSASGAGVESAGGHGLNVRANSTASLHNTSFNNSGQNGIDASDNARLFLVNVEVNGVGAHGLHIQNSSMVAQNVQANNNTGGIGLVAYRSRISFLGSTANNAGAHGLYLIGGYVAAPNLQVNNAGANGVFCQGCWLDASNMQANNAGSNGVLARDAAVVNIHNIQANDATSSGLYAFNNAVVNAEGAQFNNSVNSHNVRVLDSSNVSLGSGTQVQRTAVGINATSHCLLVGSSRVSAEGLDCSGSRGEGVTAFRNSHVDISTSTLDSGTNPNVSVSTGAIISAISIPNLNPNRTVNTLSMHGIIFAN